MSQYSEDRLLVDHHRRLVLVELSSGVWVEVVGDQEPVVSDAHSPALQRQQHQPITTTAHRVRVRVAWSNSMVKQ